MKSQARKPNWYEEYLERIGQNAEDAICRIASGLSPNDLHGWTTIEAAAHAEDSVRIFNWHAERLDQLYGFPTRLKLSSTTIKSQRDPQDVSAVRHKPGDDSTMPTVACTVAPPRSARPVGRMRLRGGRPVRLPGVGRLRPRLSKLFTEDELVRLFKGRSASPNQYRWAAESDARPRDVRRALGHSKCKLFWLSSTSRRSPAIDWMLDLLTIIETPSFERLAGVTEFPRGHVYYQRLRKTKKGQRILDKAGLLDQKTRIAEDQLKQFRRHSMFGAQANLDRKIREGRRLDNNLKEVAAGWPHWIVGGDQGRPGVLVPVIDPTTAIPSSDENHYKASPDPTPSESVDDGAIKDDDSRWQRGSLKSNDPATE